MRTTPTGDDPIAALAAVNARVHAAAANFGAVTVIAVSKTHGREKILPLIQAGHFHFGENRVQEAVEKWPTLKAAAAGIQLHLIGPLQTNKVREAVALFDIIHTVDRPKLAEKLSAEMQAQNRSIPCFAQVNTGREPQKAGLDPEAVDAFVDNCCGTWKINLVGLMCIPPLDEEPALHFAFLRELARRNGLTQLSMGMSDDYETAIAFGATHVRIGSAIFGERGL